DVAGVIGDTEDQRGHAGSAGGDLLGVQKRASALDEHLELDAAHLVAAGLLDLGDEAVDEEDVLGAVDFGDDDHVDVAARGLQDLDDVAVEVAGTDVVGAEGADLSAEVQGV